MALRLRLTKGGVPDEDPRRRLRVRRSYEAQWEGAIQGWAWNYAVTQVWRTAPEYELEDLMSEAYLAFRRCKARYPSVVEAPHFMSLFQVVFKNVIHDLSVKRTKKRKHEKLLDDCGDAPMRLRARDDPPRDVHQQGKLLTASAGLQALLAVAERGRRRKLRRFVNRTRETTQGYLERVAGMECDSLRAEVEFFLRT